MCWFGFGSPSGVCLPLRSGFMPWVLLFIPSCVLLRPSLCPAGFLIPSLIRQNEVCCWAKGGLSTVLGFWCSFLDGLEVSLLFIGCSLSGWGLFLWAARLRRFLVRCIQACTFSCIFLPIALDSSLVPKQGQRVFSRRDEGWTIAGG